MSLSRGEYIVVTHGFVVQQLLCTSIEEMASDCADVQIARPSSCMVLTAILLSLKLFILLEHRYRSQKLIVARALPWTGPLPPAAAVRGICGEG